jgi:hypothetical protein
MVLGEWKKFKFGLFPCNLKPIKKSERIEKKRVVEQGISLKKKAKK